MVAKHNVIIVRAPLRTHIKTTEFNDFGVRVTLALTLAKISSNYEVLLVWFALVGSRRSLKNIYAQ